METLSFCGGTRLLMACWRWLSELDAEITSIGKNLDQLDCHEETSFVDEENLNQKGNT
jgi:hypothetical protein